MQKKRAATPVPPQNSTGTSQAEGTRSALKVLAGEQHHWQVVLPDKYPITSRDWTTGIDNQNLADEEQTIAGNKLNHLAFGQLFSITM
jgi:hypothetical protein